MKKLATVLYGSQNYGLDVETSDKDYRTIYFPDLQTIYDAKMLTGSYYDVRRFFNNLSKCNFNALELLYSVEKDFYDDDFKTFLKEVPVMELVCENIDNLFNSIAGLIHENFKKLEKKDELKYHARVYYLVEFLQKVAREKFVDRMTFRGAHSDRAKDVRLGKTEPHTVEHVERVLLLLKPLLVPRTTSKKYTLEFQKKCQNWFWQKMEKELLENG